MFYFKQTRRSNLRRENDGNASSRCKASALAANRRPNPSKSQQSAQLWYLLSKWRQPQFLCKSRSYAFIKCIFVSSGSKTVLLTHCDVTCFMKSYSMCIVLQGRDFESTFVNHAYTQKERDILAGYESLDYLPSHSNVYKKWVRTQPSR